jgi:hypothetical protein
MSGKSKRPASLGGYDAIARRANPDYVRPDAPCDVPTCPAMVSDSRTITWVTVDGESISISIRLCPAHVTTPISELERLLPALSEMMNSTGRTGYLDLRP